MLQGEHSAILSTFIKLPFVFKVFVLSIFEWPLKAGFTVCHFSIKRLLLNSHNIDFGSRIKKNLNFMLPNVATQ